MSGWEASAPDGRDEREFDLAAGADEADEEFEDAEDDEDDDFEDDDDDDLIDDELIDLDDEYDDTEEMEKPHPGHRYDE